MRTPESNDREESIDARIDSSKWAKACGNQADRHADLCPSRTLVSHIDIIPNCAALGHACDHWRKLEGRIIEKWPFATCKWRNRRNGHTFAHVCELNRNGSLLSMWSIGNVRTIIKASPTLPIQSRARVALCDTFHGSSDSRRCSQKRGMKTFCRGDSFSDFLLNHFDFQWLLTVVVKPLHNFLFPDEFALVRIRKQQNFDPITQNGEEK